MVVNRESKLNLKQLQRSFRYLFLFFLFFLIFSLKSFAKKKITFVSDDGVTITSDLYIKANEYPYVLMFHQDGSSREEFNEIAGRIMSLGYNCLAVDLRCGDVSVNETGQYPKNHGYETSYAEAEKDVRTAVEWAFKKSGQAVILFGSSFSATLCLKVAINNARISAVIAFDPGEFLKPGYVLQDNLKDIDKPVFVATRKAGYPFIKKMFSQCDPEQLTIFTPSNDKGELGAKALWTSSENNKEYWLSLLLFFSKL